MTQSLKEQFKKLVFYNINSFNVYQNKEKDINSEACEKIADEFAIGFAEWLMDSHVSELTLKEFKKQIGL